MALLKEETLPRDQIDTIVDRKIRATTRMAYSHNLFIHELFRNAGINPNTDVRKGHAKEDLLDAYKKGVKMGGKDLSEAYADYVDGIYTEELWTSGSSGKPKKVLYSVDDFTRYARQLEGVFLAVNLDQGDNFLFFVPPSPFASGRVVQEATNRLNIRTLFFSLPPITPLMSEKEREFRARSLIDMLKSFQPDVIGGSTSSMHKLPGFLNQYGFDVKELNLKIAGFGAESSSLERREAIGKLWGADTRDIFATTEGALGYECNQHNGLHIPEPYLFLTMMDTESGEEVSKDEEGIDLVTTLYDVGEKPATFVINYSHEDISKIVGIEKCKCGRTYKRIAHPKRESERIRIANFGLDVQDAEIITSLPPYTGEYVAIYGADGKTGEYFLTLRVEAHGRPPHSEEDFMYALLRSNPIALDLFKSSLKFNVEFVKPGEIYKGFEQYIRPGKPIRMIRIR